MDIPKKIISDKLKGTSDKKDVLFKIKDSSIVWKKLSPEVQKIINSAGGVTTAEITDYMTLGGDLLPMASVFTYEGMPVSHLRTEQTNATVWDLVFCVCHKDGLENLGNLYVHYDWNSPMEGWAFVQSFDDSTAPSWILRLFNEAEATTSNSGLMSSGDKTKLNALPTSQELANTLASLVDGGSYDSVNKTIDFKHGNTILFSIDATAFIKDGMVDSVTISDGYIVITFNTDAGKESISLALTDIFNPANYYNKTAVDNLLVKKVDKVSGKGLSTEDYTTAEKNKLGGLPSTLATVATSGSYNDLLDKPTIPDAQIQSDWNQLDNTKKDFIKNKPTIPDVTTKADKVSGATNGNFAALDSNGNLIDSGHKHSDYLTQHQDLTNYVQKSQTAGLLKNDGTVDTTQYTTNTGTITGITMNGQSKGTSGNVDLGTVITDVSGKEDITPIEAVASGTTAITAQVNKYYEVAGTVSSLTVTLPTPTVNTEVTMVVVHLTVGASPTILVTSSATVAYSAAYAVVANKEYELSCLYNGSKWIVSSMEVAV